MVLQVTLAWSYRLVEDQGQLLKSNNAQMPYSWHFPYSQNIQIPLGSIFSTTLINSCSERWEHSI